jgi:iron complex transport system ATP-binding protein
MPCDGLRASGVSFAYYARLVLREISFGLRRGEMVALAGPNGSGKTTLLKLLGGARRPVAGAVTIDGTPLARLGARKVARRVAAVSQKVDARLMFTVQDIVAMGRTPYRGLFGSLDETDRRAIEAALEATDAGALAARRFGELSGGEQQRVMLAMALAQETDFVLLDEPTVHLDLHHQHEFLEVLHALQVSRRLGILAVMHDLNLAALYFDRLGIMRDGRLVADGPPPDILGRSACLEVFQAPLRVISHPQTGVPQVLLERRR